jgi:hypothetical protein
MQVISFKMVTTYLLFDHSCAKVSIFDHSCAKVSIFDQS